MNEVTDDYRLRLSRWNSYSVNSHGVEEIRSALTALKRLQTDTQTTQNDDVTNIRVAYTQSAT